MFLGIDGCRAGWVAVALGASGRWRVEVRPRLAEVLARYPDASLALVDIPIGLGDTIGARACDRRARHLLGARRASVFPAPCRAVLQAPDYPTANRENRARTGQGLSRQAWHLVVKIREADDLLHARPELPSRLRESHPELCFCALAGGAPMAGPKRTRAGQEQRVALLARYFRPARALLADTLGHHTRRQLAPDDVLDALCLAVSARLGAGRGRLRTVPEDPPRDARGLPMEIVYAEG